MPYDLPNHTLGYAHNASWIERVACSDAKILAPEIRYCFILSLFSNMYTKTLKKISKSLHEIVKTRAAKLTH